MPKLPFPREYEIPMILTISSPYEIVELNYWRGLCKSKIVTYSTYIAQLLLFSSALPLKVDAGKSNSNITKTH